jgi:TM2 domain-containing membrane protein YozV
VFCQQCGRQIPDQAKRCPVCNAPRGQIPVATVVIAPRPRNRAVYALLAVFLGFLAAHNFYAGRLIRAGIQLAISLGGAAFVVPVFVVWVWAIIEIGLIKTDGSGADMVWFPRRG